MKKRIAKFLSSAGIASRRKSEELIRDGRIKVNGEAIFDLGRQVDPAIDTILVDDKEVESNEYVYYLLNKPIGYVSTVSDRHAEKKVTELVPVDPPVWPVGRLDKDTHGLLILTNDGDLTQRLTHPKYEKEKEYLAKTDKEVTDNELGQIERGITLEDGFVQAGEIEKTGKNTYRIVIHIGKNRIVRRIFGFFGKTVIDLKRIRVNNLEIGDLPVGKFRELTENEIEDLIK